MRLKLAQPNSYAKTKHASKRQERIREREGELLDDGRG
jgi:hypothetical protein